MTKVETHLQINTHIHKRIHTLTHPLYLSTHVPVVIVRTIDIGGDDGGVVAPILLVVALVQHVNHALRIRITSVGRVRGTVVLLGRYKIQDIKDKTPFHHTFSTPQKKYNNHSIQKRTKTAYLFKISNAHNDL